VAASLKLLNARRTPGIASEIEWNGTSSLPKNAVSTAAAAPLKVLWPEVYDGNGGVGNSGSQSGSGGRLAVFSFAAVRIAVTGRQKSNRYLLSQQLIAVSASATLSSAKRRAFSMVVSPRSVAIERAMRFQWPGGVTVPSPSAQKWAMTVCSFV